jgi:hypothetical protein
MLAQQVRRGPALAGGQGTVDGRRNEGGVLLDAFVVYADNETGAGPVHPVQALKRYRDRTGIEPFIRPSNWVTISSWAWGEEAAA